MAKQCPKAGACGSCQYNGVKYCTQLEKKQEYVESLLLKYCPVARIYPMEDPFYYRNKIQSVFGLNSRGEVISGIYRQGTHKIIPINGCMLEDKVADSVLSTVKYLVKRLGLSIYNEDLQEGFLRHVLIKRALATGQIMVVLVAGTDRFPQSRVFVRELLNEHPDVTTILLNKNNGKTSMVLSDLPEKILYGDGYITDVLCGLRFRISAKSFYQVNPIQAEKLYTAAMKMARFTGSERVIDAYCGTGTIGLIASHWGAGSVVGIELNPDAVKDAENNAKLNGITNASFICGDAGDVLKQMAKDKESADVVFLDPPRAGSDEKFLASIIKLNPKTIIYISCNPVTLERDLRYLSKMSSYRIIGAQPVDMFPQCAHVETVVVMMSCNS